MAKKEPQEGAGTPETEKAPAKKKAFKKRGE